MTRLVATKGKIYKETVFQTMTMKVIFRKMALSPAGDIGEVVMEAEDQRIEITYAQALSLAQEIMRRCQ